MIVVSNSYRLIGMFPKISLVMNVAKMYNYFVLKKPPTIYGYSINMQLTCRIQYHYYWLKSYRINHFVLNKHFACLGRTLRCKYYIRIPFLFQSSGFLGNCLWHFFFIDPKCKWTYFLNKILLTVNSDSKKSIILNNIVKVALGIFRFLKWV